MGCGIKFKVLPGLFYRFIKHIAILFLCLTQLSLIPSTAYAQEQLYVSLPSTASVQPSSKPAPTQTPTPAIPSPKPSETTTSGTLPDDIVSFLSTVATLNNPVHLVNPPAGFERVSSRNLRFQFRRSQTTQLVQKKQNSGIQVTSKLVAARGPQPEGYTYKISLLSFI